MGLFGSIGGIIGARKMKKASKKAAKAQIAGMEKGIGEQRQFFDRVSGMYQPYTTAGTDALAKYRGLVGLGSPEEQQAAIEQLQASPFYQSLYRRGEEATLQNAAATGGIRGGNTQRSLADFGADTLAETIDRQLKNLGGLTEMGLGATGQVGQFGQHSSDMVTSLLAGQGQAQAQGLMNAAMAKAQMWKGIGGLADSAVSAIAGGFGAPGGGFDVGAALGSQGGQALFGDMGQSLGYPTMFNPNHPQGMGYRGGPPAMTAWPYNSYAPQGVDMGGWDTMGTNINPSLYGAGSAYDLTNPYGRVL